MEKANASLGSRDVGRHLRRHDRVLYLDRKELSVNDKIETLALDHGRFVDEWPLEAKRDAVQAVYAKDGDTFLGEACDELTNGIGECDALLLAYREPNTIMREALLGKMLDQALLRYGLIHVEHIVGERYDEWKAADRAAHAEAVYDSSREDFRRDEVALVSALVRR